MFAAALASTLTILLWSLDAETIGLGLLVPLFLLPSIAGYLLARTLRPATRYRHVAYVVPWGALLAWFTLGAILESQAEVSDTGGEMGALLAVLLATSGAAALVTLVHWSPGADSTAPRG